MEVKVKSAERQTNKSESVRAGASERVRMKERMLQGEWN